MSDYVVYQDLKGNRKAVYYSHFDTAKDHWHLIEDELIGVIEHYDGRFAVLPEKKHDNNSNKTIRESLKSQTTILVEDLSFDVDKFNSLELTYPDKWNLVKEFYEDRYTGPKG